MPFPDIAEVARRSGVPASTLRFYEEKGLIVSVVLCVFIVIIVATEKRLQVKRRVLIYFLNLAKEIPPCLHKLSVCHLGPSDRPQACHLTRGSTLSSINLFLVPK